LFFITLGIIVTLGIILRDKRSDTR